MADSSLLGNGGHLSHCAFFNFRPALDFGRNACGFPFQCALAGVQISRGVLPDHFGSNVWLGWPE